MACSSPGSLDYPYWYHPLAKRRTLIRRDHHLDATYIETVDRGRPDECNFSQCLSPECDGCGYVDFPLIAVLRSSDKNGQCTCCREKLFFDAMIVHFWGRVPGDDQERCRLRGRIESFLHSPPIKGVLAQLLHYLERNDRGMKSDSVSVTAALTEHRKTFIAYLERLRRGRLNEIDEHRFFFRRSTDLRRVPPDWTMKRLMLQFFLVSESWRLFAVEVQGARMWDLPGATAERMTDVLSAALLNFVEMRSRGAMHLRALDAKMHVEAWAGWDYRYQVFAEELARRAGEAARRRAIEQLMMETQGFTQRSEPRYEADNGEECFDGYGKGKDAENWMTKRMKSSLGWSVPGYEP